MNVFGLKEKNCRSKYIIIEHDGREVPLVFSPLLSPEQAADRARLSPPVIAK